MSRPPRCWPPSSATSWRRPHEKWSEEAEEAFKAPVREQYETQGNAYYATARLWDDGVIDPLETRTVLGLALTACANAPLPTPDPTAPGYGVFRM